MYSKQLIIIFLFIPILIPSQTISSTTTGGHWNNASTWVGGVVPGENNDVIINGVVVISNQTCRNLTINANGIIEDEPSAGRTLTVKGNLINYGTVRIGQGNFGVSLYVEGNIQNYGTLINRHIRFAGTGTQSITSTKKISCFGIDKLPNGTILALSDLEIDSTTTVDLSSDILNMGSFKLIKLSRKNIDSSGDIIKNGTIYSDGLLDISGRFGSNIDGNPTLTGTVPLLFTGGNVVNKNITIASGKEIADEPSAGRDIYIKGNLINNGKIVNRYAGLRVHVSGDVINNEVFSAYLIFDGDDNQKISGTKKFSCTSITKLPNGKINAASDIVIDSTTTVDLSSDILNMGNFKLTKLSRKNIDSSGDIIKNGTIYSDGLLDISGRFGSNIDGNPTLTGAVPLLFTGGNVVNKNITIAAGKEIADEPSAGRDIYIKGNLINNGKIVNRYAGLRVHVSGDVINNEVFSAYLIFDGDDNQKLSGTKKFSCTSITKLPNGKINAASDIVIDSTTTVDLSSDILNMGNFKLTKLSKRDYVNSDKIIYNGKIFSNGELNISGRFGSNLDGNFILTGNTPLLFTGDNVIYSNLTVSKEKIIQEECCAGRNINVYGDIINYGKIVNGFGGLTIYAYGNVFNYGDFEINWIVIRSEKNTLKLTGYFKSNISLEKYQTTNANFNIENKVTVTKRFVINSGVTLTILNGAELNNYLSIENNGEIINYGKLSSRFYIYSAGNTNIDPSLNINCYNISRANSDSLIVSYNNNSTYPNMSSSIKRWWSIKGNKNINDYIVELYYDDSILNGQDPNNLEAYLTTDNGTTWKKISNPLNTTRDISKRKITVGNSNNKISLVGDIILSSGNVVNLPSISISIGGRKEVRVGPPNRYTISYWNNNNYSTDKFFIKLNTNQGVYIDGIQTKKIGTEIIETIPIDSLVYDNKKDEVLLLVQPLGPKEVRSFDVIVKSALGPTFKTLEPITFSAVALWIGGAILEEYISNTIVAGCYEIWRPVSHDESLKDASIKVIKNSLNEAVNVENGVKGIAKKGAEEIIKKTAKVAIWPITLAKDVFDCLGNTIRGMKDYVNGNFDKQEKELVKVTSWDPNAKEGPAGIGVKGFMASTAPMTYTIFFENKKEATAPAYQIVILDTLDTNVFDVNSVKFLSTSHPQNNPTITKNGNVLKWDFVGIELPPNVNPTEGEGWVKFMVNLKPNLSSGTEIKNRAVITFDINKPLATNTFINTLDFDKPTSNISSITKTQNNELSIFWNANDANGSGIKNVIVYLSNGDGPFSVAAISNKSPINIPVQNNNTYKIYLLAVDNVGNIQESPTKIHDITVDVEKLTEEIPNEFSLEQNYPNPFNPETTINYKLPLLNQIDNSSIKSEYLVTLKIFDILGKEVTTLVNENQKPGSYSIKFNTKTVNLSSGVYFYQLKANNFIQTKKMIFMK